jgi:hypothetical protein
MEPFIELSGLETRSSLPRGRRGRYSAAPDVLTRVEDEALDRCAASPVALPRSKGRNCHRLGVADAAVPKQLRERAIGGAWRVRQDSSAMVIRRLEIRRFRGFEHVVIVPALQQAGV